MAHVIKGPVDQVMQFSGAGAKFSFKGATVAEFTEYDPVHPDHLAKLDVGLHPGSKTYIEEAVKIVWGVSDAVVRTNTPLGSFAVDVTLEPNLPHREAVLLCREVNWAINQAKSVSAAFTLHIMNMPECGEPPSRPPNVDWGWNT